MQELSEGTYRGPKFTGEPALFITFLFHFRDYCLLHVAGIKSLHAMRSRKPNSWYPRLEHNGTGRSYHCTVDDDDQDETFSTEYIVNVAHESCPAYSTCETDMEKHKARMADQEARVLLAAQLLIAVSTCATAKSRLAKGQIQCRLLHVGSCIRRRAPGSTRPRPEADHRIIDPYRVQRSAGRDIGREYGVAVPKPRVTCAV